MTGYENLKPKEIEMLCAMFNTIHFNKFQPSVTMTPIRLRAVKDKFIMGCLGAVLRTNKLTKQGETLAKRILKKNEVKEILVTKFKEDCN